MVRGYGPATDAERLKAAGAEKISTEFSASLLSPGDTVIFSSLAFMCDQLKSKTSFRKILNEFYLENNCLQLIILEENFDSANPVDMKALRLYSRIDSEWNCRASGKRSAAIAKAADAGNKAGAKKKPTDIKQLMFLYGQYRQGLVTMEQISEQTGLGRATIYRRIREADSRQ